MKLPVTAPVLLAAAAALIAVPSLAQTDTSRAVDPEVEGGGTSYLLPAVAIAIGTAVIVFVGDDVGDDPVSA